MFYFIRLGAFTVCFAILKLNFSFATAGSSRHLVLEGVLIIWLASVQR